MSKINAFTHRTLLAATLLAATVLTGNGVQAQEPTMQDLLDRIAALEELTASMRADNDNVYFEGVNVHIRNGSGSTAGTELCEVHCEGPRGYQTCWEICGGDATGLGNLIIGYDEQKADGTAEKSGFHNIVVGTGHTYTSYAGLVAGMESSVTGSHATVTGGKGNTAAANVSSVSGGYFNKADKYGSSVLGGKSNLASGAYSTVSGGYSNAATNYYTSVSGGRNNAASGRYGSVSGGYLNNAAAYYSSISGGRSNETNGSYATVSGGDDNNASGLYSSVSGGKSNLAHGEWASVSGGRENTTIGHYSSISGGYGNVTDMIASSISGGVKLHINQGLGLFDWGVGEWAAGTRYLDAERVTNETWESINMGALYYSRGEDDEPSEWRHVDDD